MIVAKGPALSGWTACDVAFEYADASLPPEPRLQPRQQAEAGAGGGGPGSGQGHGR
jgi:hypothetical protein